MPISFKGKLIQYSGRLHRTAPGKKEIRILDYIDHDNPLTIAMFKKRMKTYKLLDYKLDVPPELFQMKASMFVEARSQLHKPSL